MTRTYCPVCGLYRETFSTTAGLLACGHDSGGPQVQVRSDRRPDLMLVLDRTARPPYLHPSLMHVLTETAGRVSNAMRQAALTLVTKED